MWFSTLARLLVQTKIELDQAKMYFFIGKLYSYTGKKIVVIRNMSIVNRSFLILIKKTLSLG